jgi:branched-chain amino acid transport system ATP-binding protein
MLVVRDLDVFYGDARALEGISLDVGEREIVSIVGPNGAGKSTLVNTLSGINRPRRGTITMEGVDVTRIASHRVCRHGMAIVPEGRRIFPLMSVQENLELGAYRPEARGRRSENLQWVHELFPRLRDRAGQQAGSLSGGEQQMLAIGRALMAQPRLLLLDEPSLGLAPIVVDEVFDVIRTINAGRIVLAGTSAELLASDEVRRNVLGV